MTTRILVQSDYKSEDKSEFLVRLQRPLMNVRKISLIGMTIPNTAYTVTAHDDEFSVELESGKILSISVVQGRYSILELLAGIKGMLEVHPDNTGNWTLAYNRKTYKVMISNNVSKFRVLSPVSNLNARIGFSTPKTTFDHYQQSTQAPRMHSSPVLCLDLNIPGVSLSVPNLNQAYTFWVPFGAEFESVNILSKNDLSNQTWEINNDGVDLHEIRAKLMRTDIAQKIKLFSDVSFVLEIESS